MNLRGGGEEDSKESPTREESKKSDTPTDAGEVKTPDREPNQEDVDKVKAPIRPPIQDGVDMVQAHDRLPNQDEDVDMTTRHDRPSNQEDVDQGGTQIHLDPQDYNDKAQAYVLPNNDDDKGLPQVHQGSEDKGGPPETMRDQVDRPNIDTATSPSRTGKDPEGSKPEIQPLTRALVPRGNGEDTSPNVPLDTSKFKIVSSVGLSPYLTPKKTGRNMIARASLSIGESVKTFSKIAGTVTRTSKRLTERMPQFSPKKDSSAEDSVSFPSEHEPDSSYTPSNSSLSIRSTTLQDDTTKREEVLKIYEDLQDAVAKRCQLLSDGGLFTDSLALHEANASIALHTERMSFSTVGIKDRQILDIKDQANDLVKAICPEASNAISVLDESVAATSSGMVTYDIGQPESAMTMTVGQEMKHRSPHASDNLIRALDEHCKADLLLQETPANQKVWNLLDSPGPGQDVPSTDLDGTLLLDNVPHNRDGSLPALPAPEKPQDNEPTVTASKEPSEPIQEKPSNVDEAAELTERLNDTLRQMEGIQGKVDELDNSYQTTRQERDQATARAEMLNKKLDELRIETERIIQASIEAQEANKRPTKNEMKVKYRWTDAYSSMIPLGPNDSCLNFMEQVLNRWFDRHFGVVCTRTMTHLAKALWNAAKITTFRATIEVAEGIDHTNMTRYQDGMVGQFLHRHATDHLVAHLRGSRGEKILSISIDPMSDQVLREAWTAGMIVWLPLIIGIRYRDIAKDPIFVGELSPDAPQVRYLTSLLSESYKIYEKLSAKYKGMILNKAHILDIARRIDSKDKLSKEEVSTLTWYLRARQEEGSLNYKDVKFNHAYLDGVLVRATPVVDVERKAPPKPAESQNPEDVTRSIPPTVSNNEKKAPGTIPPPPSFDIKKTPVDTPISTSHEKGDSPEPSGTDTEQVEIPEVIPSTHGGTNEEHVDKRPTEEDILKESQFLTKPIPPGQKAPELRWASLVPPEGQTHFTGRFKSVPQYKSGTYIGCVPRWTNYPLPLTYEQLPDNAQESFHQGGEHWANRVFYDKGMRYRFNEDGSMWHQEDVPTKSEPKETSPSGLPPTPWSEKARKEKADYPLRYEPAPHPETRPPGSYPSNHSPPFQADESSIKKEGSYHQDTHVHSGSSPTHHSVTPNDFRPYVDYRDEDEYRERDHVMLQKDVRGYSFKYESPFQEYNVEMQRKLEEENRRFGSTDDQVPFGKGATSGLAPSRRHFDSNLGLDGNPGGIGQTPHDYGGTTTPRKGHLSHGNGTGAPGGGGIPPPGIYPGGGSGPPPIGGRYPDGGGSPPPGGHISTTAAAPGGISIKPLMKPDVKAYPILKAVAEYSKWYDDAYALARAQGIECIFDHTFVPAGMSAKQVFHYVQAFMYAVLRRTIRPPELWQYIEFYSKHSDAQACLIAITNHVRKSTYAIITLRDNMQAIVNARMIKDWKGSALEFIIAFDAMMDEYNKNQASRQLWINSHQKRQYLQNAVTGVRGLQDVLDRETDRVTMGDLPFTYEQYLHTLKSVATRLDDKRKKEGRRFANWHDIDVEDTPSKIEANVSEVDRMEYLINEAKRRKDPSDYAAQMNRDTWKSLKPETQEAWDKLPKEEKIKLLTYSKDRHDRRNAKVNFTDISDTMDINNHEIKGDEVEDDQPSKDDSQESSGELKVNTSEWKIHNAEQRARSEAHPGDIRRMMGTNSPALASIEAKLHQCLYPSLDTGDEDSSSEDDTQDFQ